MAKVTVPFPGQLVIWRLPRVVCSSSAGFHGSAVPPESPLRHCIWGRQGALLRWKSPFQSGTFPRNVVRGRRCSSSRPFAGVYFHPAKLKGRSGRLQRLHRGRASETPGALSGPKVLKGWVPDQCHYHLATFRNTR